MRHRSIWALLASVASAACVCGAFILACSSGGGGGAGDGANGAANGNGNGADGSVSTACNGALHVVFSPMYSAYDGAHTFQVPAIVDGLGANASPTWSASDPSLVAIAPDPTTGGAMITTQKAGTVTITARAGDQCGTSTLTVTQATADDWQAGNARYNDGVVLRFGHRDGGAGADAGPPPQEAACTNCHGDNANGPFKDVAHTPEQTGGFSDDALVSIFTQGTVPDGGYFDSNIISYARWQQFHKWEMTPDEAKGLVVYLRSLTPEAQNGSSNFGGHDGGFGDGGHHRHDGGPDASGPTPSDAAATD